MSLSSVGKISPARKPSASGGNVAKKKPTKKRPVKKASDRSAKKSRHPKQRRIGAELAERAFMRWAEEYRDGSGFAGLAAEFGFQRDSWRARARKDGWEARYQRYLEKSQKKTENDLAKRHTEKLKQFRGLGNATFRSLFKEIPDPSDPKKNILVLKIDATVQEAIAAAKYEDDLTDKFPDRADESASTMTEEEVKLFTAAIEMLGSEGLKAMGKLIVEKEAQLVKAQQPEE